MIQLRPDSTTNELRTVLARLDRLPQVAAATPEYVLDPVEGGDFVKPEDDAGQWAASSYSLNLDSTVAATGPVQRTWGLSAIGAPWAWGCTAGSAGVHVAVVDDGFHAHADMQNVTNTGWNSNSTSNHGLIVGSVLGASGNNNAGIAGVMWHANLTYHDVKHPASLRTWLGVNETHQGVWSAMQSGARVINLSRKLEYYVLNNGQPVIVNGKKVLTAPTGSTGEINRARRVGKSLAAAIRAHLSVASDPLFVVSAGNYGVDAILNGYTNALNDISDRMIVVGAAAPTVQGSGDFSGSYRMAVFNPNSIEKGSNFGTLVEIAAPGWQVGALTNQQAPTTQSGTSVAAPYVAGTAGLMLSLDATLTAAELKQLLLQGAAIGGRKIVNGPSGGALPLPLLNAYESLRLVAQREGAGVCSNPMWQDSVGGIVAKRGAGWGGTIETLFSASGKAGMSP